MKIAILAAAACVGFLATPAAADWAGGHSPGYGWHPDTAFPSTPPIQRYGKGIKGVKRFGRGLSRDAEFRRWQEDNRAFHQAAVRTEDVRARCDILLRNALERGDQAEIVDARERCKPRAYGPYPR
jgi:hypothetical protein